MLKPFGHHTKRRLLFLALAEAATLFFIVCVNGIVRHADGMPIVSALMSCLPQAVVIVAAGVLCMVTFGLYERGRVLDTWSTVIRLAGAFIAVFVLVTIVSHAVPETHVQRSGLGIALPAAFVAILFLRCLLGGSSLARSFDHRVIVVGDMAAMAGIHTILEGRAGHRPAVIDRLAVTGPLLRSNDPRALRRRAERTQCDEIVVAVEGTPTCPLLAAQLLECRSAGIPVVDVAEFRERQTGRVDLDRLRPSRLVPADGFATGRHEPLVGRLFDVTVALTVLVLCLPLVVLTMLAIRLDDGGPVFYRQMRIGRHGRAFPLVKFRSMRTDAEACGPRYAEANDPRVTRVGRVIRRTRIDELPQLLNVLRGEMSFVGPRPERPVFVRELEHRLPVFKERHRIKPGISGWAQVNHAYTSTVEDARVKLEFDMYYLKNKSLLLDFLIVARTLRVVVRGSGAR